jgi:hypothetical protein
MVVVHALRFGRSLGGGILNLSSGGRLVVIHRRRLMPVEG